MSDHIESNVPPVVSDVTGDKKKSGRKSKVETNSLGDLKILDYPNRTLPKLIEDLLEKNFSVILAKDGYYVGGFYGLHPEIGRGGYAFAQDTTESNTLVFHDAKGGRHPVRNFEELVHFNNHVWGMFYKLSADYKKPNPQWFAYMLEYGALTIMPGGR